MQQSPSNWVALEAGADRKAAARRLARIHERVHGDGADPDGVRDVIADSWVRSSSAGLDSERGLAPKSISRDEAQARWEGSPLRSAAGILAGLLDDVGEAGRQVALVCDAEGTMLWIDGDEGIVDAGHEIHLEAGSVWSEDEAGTNAMGTALAVDHPIQVFSAEHFAAPVHGWTCSAAPIHDPETGEPLGVIDLSGELKTAHPHSLALVRMAARMVEAEIAAERAVGHRRLVQRFGHRVGDSSAHGLLSQKGTVLSSPRAEWLERRLDVPSRGGVLDVEGVLLVAEPLDGGGFLVWPSAPSRPRGSEPPAELEEQPVRLEMLGTDRGTVHTASGARRVSRRQTEILTLLALRPRGLTAEQIALELYGEAGKPVSARAELSRIRSSLGLVMEANPYRFSPPLSSDFLEIGALVRSGRVREALELYRGPLLPRSEVPAIVEARSGLENLIRDAVMTRGDAFALQLWTDTESGRDDLEANRRLAAALDRGDPSRAAALGRLRRLSQSSRL